MLYLKKIGKIKHIGVSNFTLTQLLTALYYAQKDIFSIQNEFNLMDRTIEDKILPYCQTNDIKVFAYSALGVGRIVDTKAKFDYLTKLGKKYGKTIQQVILNFITSFFPTNSSTMHCIGLFICAKRQPQYLIFPSIV